MTIFQISATLPVTTAAPERPFSQLHALKTYVQSSMKEERLNGLALLYVHRDEEAPSDKIIEDFAKMKALRLKVAL